MANVVVPIHILDIDSEIIARIKRAINDNGHVTLNQIIDSLPDLDVIDFSTITTGITVGYQGRWFTLNLLDFAIIHNRFELVRALLRLPKAPVDSAAELLYSEGKQHQVEIVRLMMEDPRLRMSYARKQTLLMKALFRGDTEAIEYLLDRGHVDVNDNLHENEYAGTPLFQVCQENLPEMATLLLRHPKTNPARRLADGQTLLSVSLEVNAVDCVRALIAHVPVLEELPIDVYLSLQHESLPTFSAYMTQLNHAGVKTATPRDIARAVGSHEAVALYEAYLQDPRKARIEAMHALKIRDERALQFAGLPELLEEGYIRVKEAPCNPDTAKFFKILMPLPRELRDTLCHMITGSTKTCFTDKQQYDGAVKHLWCFLSQ